MKKRITAILLLSIFTLSLNAFASDVDPILRSGVKPDYPTEARLMAVEGIVLIEALIDESGKVFGAEVIKSVHPLLDKSALDAVKKWKFTPAYVDGKATLKVVRIPIRFNLRDAEEDKNLAGLDVTAVART